MLDSNKILPCRYVLQKCKMRNNPAIQDEKYRKIWVDCVQCVEPNFLIEKCKFRSDLRVYDKIEKKVVYQKDFDAVV